MSFACNVDTEDVATTFADPTSDPDSMGSNSSAEATGDDAPEDSETQVATGDVETSGGATGDPADEQPEDGMYSECLTNTDCIGLTSCVLVGGASTGFCTSAGCKAPASDCAANPGATATAAPACVEDATGAQVCALACSMDATCPLGMECLALGEAMVCV
ncbi:MAG: hypothetical protein AAF799_18130 [Myxococcota bacterium]